MRNASEVYQLNGRDYVYDPTRRGDVKPIPKVVKARASGRYLVWVEYENGEAGMADLTDLAESPSFRSWKDERFFETVRPDGDTLAWGDGEVDIAPETVYMRVTGVDLDKVFPIRFLDVAHT